MSRDPLTPKTPHRRTSRFSLVPQGRLSRASVPADLLNASFSTTATHCPFGKNEGLSERLGSSLRELGQFTSDLNKNLEILRRLNEESLEFNFRFSAFTTALDLNAQAISFPEAITLNSLDSAFRNGFPLNSVLEQQDSYDHILSSPPRLEESIPQNIPELITESVPEPKTPPTKSPRPTQKKRSLGKFKSSTAPKKTKRSTFPVDLLLSTLTVEHRISPHFEKIETIIKEFDKCREELSKQDIVSRTGIPSHTTHIYLNALVQTKNLSKKASPGGTLFELNQIRYPPQKRFH